ncbi:DUF5819 family protein [Catenulispora subtropica]|uniref:DUF5819 family protein n=1 Tax=Catenulispora subtropica TaxID=450798 RepID=UPI0031D200CD
MQLAVTGAVALCVSAAVVHVALVFLYVAPANTVSRQYQSQIDAWIYPYFEQDWRLFAPDPQSTHQQISARTSTVAANGVTQTSDWIDLTAVDDAAVRHDVFPSHTAQNMLRRAWDAYETALGTDARLTSRRTLMLQEYLRNIAVQRAATRVHEPFDAIQLRVVTTPIEQPSVRPVSNRPAASAPGVRYLPWWQVTTDDL